MSVTVNRDLVAVADEPSADLVVSMDDRIAMLDTDLSQFSTMLMKLPVTTAKSFKEQWQEDQYLPKNTALSASVTNSATTLPLTTGEGNYAKTGDTFMFVESGERGRITGVSASAWTVVRAIGSTAAATAASGTVNGGIIILAGSNEEGARRPTAIVTAKTSNYNYVSRIRNSYEYTGTDEWNDHYSGNPLAYQRKKIALEHKRDVENQVWFGARSYTAAGAVTSKAQSTFGGIDEYISTNITDAAGTFDKGELQDFLRSGLEYGDPTRKVLFAAPIVAQVCSEFLQDNWVMAPPGTNVFGAKVDFVISGVTGAKIPVVVKNDWKRYGEGSGKHIGSRAYLIDMTQVDLVKAPATSRGPRYLSLYQHIQENDEDLSAEEYFSELTLRVKNEKSHSKLTGVTG
jgi:hypothetical protein